MTTVIWRVECEGCKLGPHSCYCPQRVQWRRDIMIYSSEDSYLVDHPGLLMDVFNMDRWSEAQEMYCGFFSEDALQSWFSDLLEELAFEGFKLALYQTDHFMVGASKKQVFFRKDLLLEYRPIRCGAQYV